MFQYSLYLFAYWINIYKNINSGWKQNKASWEILLMLNFYTFLAKLLIEGNRKKRKDFCQILFWSLYCPYHSLPQGYFAVWIQKLAKRSGNGCSCVRAGESSVCHWHAIICQLPSINIWSCIVFFLFWRPWQIVILWFTIHC